MSRWSSVPSKMLSNPYVFCERPSVLAALSS